MVKNADIKQPDELLSYDWLRNLEKRQKTQIKVV